ncbi:WhiB family transcriptional regulator [Streptomyces anandii]|uniref:WhiB family transcriptional regulator n=1 Tax=Streptomyces anandii TaxID=285454 RepID=UPI0037B24A77
MREWLDGIRLRPWLPDAACGKDFGPKPDFFHSKQRKERNAAKKFCESSCPVRAECLEDAMRHEARVGHRSGVFGGLTAEERRQLAAERRKAAGGVR